MISSKYGCASPEQNGGETPRNLLSSDDERVPVELIRVAFIKTSVLRSPISEPLFLISTSVATNINFQILKATFWHTIGQLFGNFVAQCGFSSCGIHSGDYESYNLVRKVIITYSFLPGWPGAWLLSLHNRIGSLSNDNGDGNENGKKKSDRFNLVPRLSLTEPWEPGCNRFRLAKQQLCTCITVFCNFHCRRCTTYDVKLPNLTFYGGREHKTAIFFFFSWTSIQSIRIQLQKSSPLFVELKPGKVWSSANSLFKWRFSSRRRRCCLSSLISIKRPGERAQRGGETALLSLYSRYESAPKNRTLLLSLSSPVFRPHDSGTLARILAIG